MHDVRDKEGLTHAIYAGVNNDTFADGSWQVLGILHPSYSIAGRRHFFMPAAQLKRA